MEVLQELNEKQQQAVTHTKGAILVVAGPGTGKTKVITHRIAHLIHRHHVPPQQIFAVTFTNKAAQEMLERVKVLLGTTQGLDVRIHTFHAFCVNLLREHAPEIGLSKNFTIFDQETQDEVLIECLRELKLNRLDYPPWLLRDIIGAYKVKLESPIAEQRHEIHTGDGTVIDDAVVIENITALLKAYQSKLAYHNALDFDDLIFKSVEVLEQSASVRAGYHNAIRFMLVDEYQDINVSQYALIKHLCRTPDHNLMVVADEDQSIYSWRGSSPQYIEDFKADFQPIIVELEEHYRCSEKILRAAQAVIARNTRQKESILKTHQEAGNTLYHYTFGDPDKESAYVAKLIRQLVDKRHYSYGHIAVFYRTHQLAEALVDRLHHENVQFQRIGRANSFQENHAKNIVSYLSFIQWQLPRDLDRAINFPQQLIDDLTLVRLKWLAQRDGITLVELLRKIDDYPEDVGPLTRQNVRKFFQQIDQFSQEIEGEKISKIAIQLFDLLERRSSPYRNEEIHEIENRLEIPRLQTAADALYSAIKRGEPIRISTSSGIDSNCAAHIVHQTLEGYLDLPTQIQFLPENNREPEASDGVDVLIGDFSQLPETKSTTILIGMWEDAPTDDGEVNVIQLSQTKKALSHCKSIIALKLCQRLLSYFETPNLADMIVYDLETVDNDPKRAEIIEIGAKRLSAIGSELERYYQLVKPPHPIPKSSTKIHGIDNESVKESPSIETVLPQFLGFIQDRILIGHNVVEFDNQVLERDLGKYLNIGLSNPYYDTLVTAQRLYPRESCNLEALADKFNIEHDTMHRAIEDVHVTHRVFDELIEVDLRRREMQSLTEFLPFVGLGLLESGYNPVQSNGDTEEDAGDQDSQLEEAFFQAATRYIKTYIPTRSMGTRKVEDLFADHRMSLQPTEMETIKGFIESLQKAKLPDLQTDEDWTSRRAQFMNGVLHFETNSNAQQLSDFLDYQKLINSADETEIDTDKITLMTLHAAKGTEFRAVIIMGMEEGTFPIWRKDPQLAEIEEERRLFYVGMTRAQEQLYLTSATRRRSDRERVASMFIREIPSNLIRHWSPPRRRRI